MHCRLPKYPLDFVYLMTWTARYLTHPQVLIDPQQDVRRWGLNSIGRARVAALAGQLGALSRTTRVISSDEVKALETAAPLAAALKAGLEIRPRMHENDRSATGYLPPEVFEAVADAFFAQPFQSVRGWETAHDAQQRIIREVEDCLTGPQSGDVLFVGHGAVGTLLYCALSQLGIGRAHDQSHGGGCWFEFGLEDRKPSRPWQPMEALMQGV